MVHRVSKRTVALCALVSSAVLLAACGGRYRTQHEEFEEDPTSGAGAGGAGKGGASSVGGKPAGKAGTSSTAGAPSAGGSATTCNGVACTNIGCAQGFIPTLPPGACCPVCVADPAACEKGKQSYVMEREGIANKASFGCSQDSECSFVQASNACSSCAGDPVYIGNADYYENALQFAADSDCSTCKEMPPSPCLAPELAYCDQGQCRIAK